MFAVNGLTLGSWVSRVPAAQETLGLSVAQMGTLLLAPGVGSVIGMPIAGYLVARTGPRRSLLLGATGTTIALLMMICGLIWPTTIAVAAGLGLYGLGIGLWDVAMNVAGGDLESQTGQSLLPRLHASLSLGTIVGSAAGVAASATSVTISTQLVATGIVAAAGVAAAAKYLPTAGKLEAQSSSTHDSATLGLADAIREPRTLLIGITVLAFALCEGVAGNWLALSLVNGHDTSQSIGALGYAVFVSALTAGRATGSILIHRYGRVTSLRTLAGVLIAGVLLVIYADSLPIVLIGCALWGLGTSLGFPAGMSAAADDIRNAPVRVSVVSWIGYGAFFSAPPLVAYLINLIGTLPALLSVVGASAVALITAGAAQPLDAPFQESDVADPNQNTA